MFIRGSRFSLHYLSPQIDWEHVRKHKSLCTLSQHLHLSIIAGRKCPLSANHCQVSESPFRGSDWVMLFFCFFSKLVESAIAHRLTQRPCQELLPSHEESFTHVSLCFTLGKVSPHVSSGLYKRDKMVFGGFFFFFPQKTSKANFLTLKNSINWHQVRWWDFNRAPFIHSQRGESLTHALLCTPEWKKADTVTRTQGPKLKKKKKWLMISLHGNEK